MGTVITNSLAIDGAVTQAGAALEERMCRSPSFCAARSGQALQGLDVQPQSCKEVAKVVRDLRCGQKSRCGLAGEHGALRHDLSLSTIKCPM